MDRRRFRLVLPNLPHQNLSACLLPGGIRSQQSEKGLSLPHRIQRSMLPALRSGTVLDMPAARVSVGPKHRATLMRGPDKGGPSDCYHQLSDGHIHHRTSTADDLEAANGEEKENSCVWHLVSRGLSRSLFDPSYRRGEADGYQRPDWNEPA